MLIFRCGSAYTIVRYRVCIPNGSNVSEISEKIYNKQTEIRWMEINGEGMYGKVTDAFFSILLLIFHRFFFQFYFFIISWQLSQFN